ncbi:MAG TPA: hypothetical protein VIY56_17360 [Vicinamibacterales bacterium]
MPTCNRCRCCHATMFEFQGDSYAMCAGCCDANGVHSKAPPPLTGVEWIGDAGESPWGARSGFEGVDVESTAIATVELGESWTHIKRPGAVDRGGELAPELREVIERAKLGAPTAERDKSPLMQSACERGGEAIK